MGRYLRFAVLLGVASSFVVLVALAVSALRGSGLLSGDPITFENFLRIRPGMTEGDVEATFGRPADFGPLAVPDAFRHPRMDRAIYKGWQGSDRFVTVVFDPADGRVLDSSHYLLRASYWFL